MPVSERICLSPPPLQNEARERRKIDMVKVLYSLKLANYIQFRAQRCQKYASYQKKFSNKSCLKLNFVQKSPRAYMSVSPQSRARGRERLIWLKYYSTEMANYII